MKKRAIILLLTGCMTIGTLFTGCGSINSLKKAAETVTDEVKSEDGEEEETDKDEAEKDDKAKKKSAKSDTPVLGSEEAEGYEGFTYLYEELLMTDSEEDEEGKMKNTKLTVFIPKDEYAGVNRNHAYAEKMGVSFNINLNPYIRYDQEDFSVAENLEMYLEDEYDEFYTTDYKDLEISDVTELDKDAAVVTAKYCKYNSWDDQYDVIFHTYCLREVEPDVTVLVDVEINHNEVTGKTEALLEEIEAFYEFDVDWDSSEAEMKLEQFLANDDGDTETVSTGFIKFDLPKGWEEDRDRSSYQMAVYAPGGDTDFADCGIGILREYVGDGADSLSMLLTDTSFAEEFIGSQFGEDVSDISVEEYGTTCIGDTTLIKCEMAIDGKEGRCGFYMSGKKSYIYAIVVIEGSECEEDVFGIAENILENGKLNE